MLTMRLNFTIAAIISIIAVISLYVNYKLVSDDKKTHLEFDMKNNVKNKIEHINELLSLNVDITPEILDKLAGKYSLTGDIVLFTAFIDKNGELLAQHNLPTDIQYKTLMSDNHGYSNFIDDDKFVYMVVEIKLTKPIFVISGFTKESLMQSLFDEMLIVALLVFLLVLAYIGYIFYFTYSHVESPLQELFERNLKDFVNGIVSSNVDCNTLTDISKIHLPPKLNKMIYSTLQMLQKWSCYKIHFDEFLRITIAETDKKQLVDNLYFAIQDDFYIKQIIVFEINHSLNRFEPITAGDKTDEESVYEGLFSEPNSCSAYRTGTRVLVDESKRSACSTCKNRENETLLCKPMMTSGKQIGVIRLTLDNDKIAQSEEISGSLETKIRFLESYLNPYVDLTSLTLSNINLLNAYKNQALTDPLTNLYNRRYITEYLYGILNIAKQKETPLSIFMIDVDNFKHFNDQYGHKVGDSVLKVVSLTISNAIRAGDTVARYGGEEFIVVLPYSDVDVAFEVGERVRNAIESIEWADYELPKIQPVTISVGIATYPKHGYSHYHLTNIADKALYKAKKEGRNRVVVHEIKERETNDAV